MNSTPKEIEGFIKEVGLLDFIISEHFANLIKLREPEEQRICELYLSEIKTLCSDECHRFYQHVYKNILQMNQNYEVNEDERIVR